MAINLSKDFPEYNELEYPVDAIINTCLAWEKDKAGQDLATFRTELPVITDIEFTLAYNFMAAMAKKYGIPAELANLMGICGGVMQAHQQCKQKFLNETLEEKGEQ